MESHFLILIGKPNISKKFVLPKLIFKCSSLLKSVSKEKLILEPMKGRSWGTLGICSGVR